MTDTSAPDYGDLINRLLTAGTQIDPVQHQVVVQVTLGHLLREVVSLRQSLTVTDDFAERLDRRLSEVERWRREQTAHTEERERDQRDWRGRVLLLVVGSAFAAVVSAVVNAAQWLSRHFLYHP